MRQCIVVPCGFLVACGELYVVKNDKLSCHPECPMMAWLMRWLVLLDSQRFNDGGVFSPPPLEPWNSHRTFKISIISSSLHLF